METINNHQLLNFAKKAHSEGNPFLAKEILEKLIHREHDSQYSSILGDAYISLNIANSSLGYQQPTNNENAIEQEKINKKLEEIVTQDLDLYFDDPQQKLHAITSYGLHLLRIHQYKKAYPFYKYTQPVTNQALNVTPLSMSCPNPYSNQQETFLIYSAGGFGDIIQYARFLEATAKFFSQHQIYFVSNKELHWIFNELYGNQSNPNQPNTNQHIPNLKICSFEHPDQIPSFTHHTNIHTLPAILNLDYQDIYENHYLKNLNIKSEDLSNNIRKKLSSKKLNIVINWHGKDINSAEEHYRSISLKTLLPFLAEFQDKINWLIVQKELSTEDREILKISNFIQNLEPDLDLQTPFKDTINLFKNEIDLVISSDTVYPHIAGTLDIPCWILLTTGCDWRWVPKDPETTTRWYPKIKQFRQETYGDWTPVLAHLREELSNFISQDQPTQPTQTQPTQTQPNSDQIQLETLTDINI